MARFFHLVTTDANNTFAVAPDWMPVIENGRLIVTEKDGTTGSFPLADVVSSFFTTKRNTPARDQKVAAADRCVQQLAEAKAALGIPAGTLDPELELYVEAAVALTQAKDALTNHDLACHKAKVAAAEARKNPKPKPESKPKTRKTTKK